MQQTLQSIAENAQKGKKTGSINRGGEASFTAFEQSLSLFLTLQEKLLVREYERERALAIV